MMFKAAKWFSFFVREASRFSNKPSIPGPDSRIYAFCVFSISFAYCMLLRRQDLGKSFPVVGAVLLHLYLF
jgi:hypothetical protein